MKLKKIKINKTALWVSSLLVLTPLFIFLVLDRLFPLPLPDGDADFSVAVVSDDGTPLRGFPDRQGVWRYPVRPGDVSPRYLEALINYEDRWFYHHTGVNPMSLVRAVKDLVRLGRPVSGGSTLTMQVARILDPHSKSIPGKVKQMFRAWQLELHFTKQEILTFYLNYAPFGGPIEGVQAASFTYLGKSAEKLSRAEAALLAVLPQAPSRLRPDRHPERAARARNKVLRRLADFGLWDRETVKEAMIEKVAARFEPRPLSAPLLARRLKKQAVPGKAVITTIDLYYQQTVEDLVRTYVSLLPPHTSAAALVVDNRTLAVKAYVGSAEFLDEERFGHVDMIQANRSPGSTLKPFLYAMAMEEGLIHSESLLVDAPLSFSGYRPGNFNEGFAGPVSASQALSRSLNIPAVDLLDRLGPKYFDARLRQGGVHLAYPGHGGPNLALILGGAGANLEELAGAYTAFARQGLAGKVRLAADDPLIERRLLDPGSAFIIREILAQQPRPELYSGRVSLARSRQVAWKTGTSYGFRDAWAIGVTDRFTVGVWTGRPDGTPSPGQYGRATAAPLLFNLIDALPRSSGSPPHIPDNVAQEEICWPLGLKPDGKNDPLCHQRRTAWILADLIPPTLPDRADNHWLSNPANILINPDTGLRVDADCPIKNPVQKKIARWPKAANPWLSPRLRAASALPDMDPACGKPVSSTPDNIKILGIANSTIFRPRPADNNLPTIPLEALGGKGQLFWMLNDILVAETKTGQPVLYQFTRPGRYRLTVMDQAGNYDQVQIEVAKGWE